MKQSHKDSAGYTKKHSTKSATAISTDSKNPYILLKIYLSVIDWGPAATCLNNCTDSSCECASTVHEY